MANRKAQRVRQLAVEKAMRGTLEKLLGEGFQLLPTIEDTARAEIALAHCVTMKLRRMRRRKA